MDKYSVNQAEARRDFVLRPWLRAGPVDPNRPALTAEKVVLVAFAPWVGNAAKCNAHTSPKGEGAILPVLDCRVRLWCAAGIRPSLYEAPAGKGPDLGRDKMLCPHAQRSCSNTIGRGAFAIYYAM
jgi:hypothetical protein